MSWNAPPRTKVGFDRGVGIALVHDELAHRVELLRALEGLREEVGVVVVRANERHLDLEGLDHVADEEVPALGPRVVTRVTLRLV